MRGIVRFRSLVALTLLTALLLSGLPRGTDAASGSPQIATSTYQSGQWCDDHDGESVCAIKSGGAFTLLQIGGTRFSTNGLALVTVTNLLTWSTVSSGIATVNGSGQFLFKTPDIEICTGGTPISIQVFDILKQQYSNPIFLTACRY